MLKLFEEREAAGLDWMEPIRRNVRLRMGRGDFILVGVMRGERGLMLGIRLVDDEKEGDRGKRGARREKGRMLLFHLF